MLLNNYWARKSKKYMGWSKSGTKREIYSTTGLPQETKTISNKKNLTLHITNYKKETNEAQSQ